MLSRPPHLTNYTCEGQVCSEVYGERVCHKPTEAPERDVTDELAVCVEKCTKDLDLDFKIYRQSKSARVCKVIQFIEACSAVSYTTNDLYCRPKHYLV